MKFWGNMAHLRPREVLLQYPAIVSSMAEMLHSEDVTAQTVALETLGYIGVSLEGKSALLESGNLLTDCVDKLASLLHDSCTELKISVLNTLASLLKLDKENQSPEMLSVTESWFRRSPDLIVTVTGLIKQPFLDLRYHYSPFSVSLSDGVMIRLAGYQLLLVLAGQDWGRSLVMSQPGFCESLLDRSRENQKDGKLERWRLVERLVESRHAKQLLGPQIDIQMRQFVKEGPYYVQVQSEVAYDEQE